MSLSKYQRARCLEVMDELCSHKVSQMFAQPVDPARDNCPNYFDVIKNPMDLGTVKKKLKANQYKTVEEWKKDVNLIWSNCNLYNAKTSLLRVITKDLSNIYHKLTMYVTDYPQNDWNEQLQNYYNEMNTIMKEMSDPALDVLPEPVTEPEPVSESETITTKTTKDSKSICTVRNNNISNSKTSSLTSESAEKPAPQKQQQQQQKKKPKSFQKEKKIKKEQKNQSHTRPVSPAPNSSSSSQTPSSHTRPVSPAPSAISTSRDNAVSSSNSLNSTISTNSTSSINSTNPSSISSSSSSTTTTTKTKKRITNSETLDNLVSFKEEREKRHSRPFSKEQLIKLTHDINSIDDEETLDIITALLLANEPNIVDNGDVIEVDLSTLRTSTLKILREKVDQYLDEYY